MKRNAIIIGLLLFSVVASPAGGALTSLEQSQLTRINNAINAAARLYLRNDFRECGTELRKAQIIMEKLATRANDELLKALEAPHKRLQRAHQLVSEKGETLPAIKPLPTPAEAQAAREAARAAAKERAAKRAAAAAAAKDGTKAAEDAIDAAAEKTDTGQTTDEETEAPEESDTSPAPDTGTEDAVSFTKQVAPILVGRCGRCHVDDSKGDFEMPTYAALMKGPESGPVIVAKKPDDSTLIQLVEDGEMPPRDGPIPAKDVKLLKDWVAQGAKYDGKSRTTKLTSLVPAEGRPDSSRENRTSRTRQRS
jgi:hypothetical protein